MVGITTLKSYGFIEIDEYFNYIIESKINGNSGQVIDLMQKLNKDQRISFFQYMIDNNYHKSDVSLFSFLMIIVLGL